MKLFSKLFLVFFSLIFLNSCSHTGKKKPYDYLEIYFLDPGLKFPMNIPCDALRSEMLKEKVRYKLIENEDSLKLFKHHFSTLKNDTASFNFDVKIQIIYHSLKKTDTICMGSNFNIAVNSVKKQESKDFHNFIRQNIYGSNSIFE